MGSYKTVAKEGIAESTIEKSRFIARVISCETEEEARAFFAAIKDEYKDATHNVPVMVIGESQEKAWSSEDGEPQGTAGAPVLKMITEMGLTDLAIVITRYFGGIKLGTGGLVRAYTDVAKKAVDNAGIAVVQDMASYEVTTDYKTFNRIESYASEAGFEITDKAYGENVSFNLITPLDQKEKVKESVFDLSKGNARIGEPAIIKSKIIG